MMNWEQLLSHHRIGKASQKEREAHRLPSQYDHDRVVFSSAFRRLQDKTQVFPLSSSDYIRTRLTHSMEVAAVARSLGNLVGFLLRDEKKDGLPKNIHPLELGMVVSAAALAHDIGNPPFGHSGEKAIQSWFSSSPVVKPFWEGVFTPRQNADFQNFEGNAQGFRIVMSLQMYRDNGGMQLTAATLGAFSKYPCEVRLPSEPEPKKGNVDEKKFGFFQAEAGRFEEVADMVGLLRRPGEKRAWCRHPLAILVEAADDICYRIVDFEDAFQQKLVGAKEVRELLARVVATRDGATKSSVLKRAHEEPNDREAINYLRSRAIGAAVDSAAEAFVLHRKEILAGKFHSDLISKTACGVLFEKIKRTQVEHVYTNDRVLRVEAAGFQVIGGLLEAFLKAVNDVFESKKPAKNGDKKLPAPESEKLFALMPDEFVGPGRRIENDPYLRLLRVTDYVCGMTDSYALTLYRNIAGISLP